MVTRQHPSPPTMIGRALTLRCPHCGSGHLYKSWFRSHARCPGCGLRLERGEEGYRVGTYMFNLVGSELVFITTFLLVVFYTWPDPPWNILQWAGPLFMLMAPLVFWPFAKLLFLAFDLSFRPVRPEDVGL